MDNSRYRNRDLNEAAAAAGAAFGTMSDEVPVISRWNWRVFTVMALALCITATLLGYLFG